MSVLRFIESNIATIFLVLLVTSIFLISLAIH